MYTGYKILATLQLEHEFYPDNICRDLDFILPVDTARALAAKRILVKITGGGLQLLAPLRAVGGAYLYPPEAGEQLQCTLGIRFTQPGLRRLVTATAAGTLPLWSNPAGVNTWTTRNIRLCSRNCNYNIVSTTRPLKVRLVKEGVSMDTQLIPSEAGIPGAQKITSCNIDLKQLPSGFYEIYEQDTQTAALFRQDELAAAAADMLVQLRIDPCFAAPQTTKFSIALPVLKNKWIYWLVRNAGAIPAGTYSIVDARPGVNGDKLLFDPVDNSSTQTMAARLGLPADRVLGFQTRTATGLKQAPLANLQLKKNADIILKNLPNPALNSSTNDILIPIQ